MDYTDDEKMFVVICGYAHIAIDGVHYFNEEDAITVMNDTYDKLSKELSKTTNEKMRKKLGWRLHTLNIEELVLH